MMPTDTELPELTIFYLKLFYTIQYCLLMTALGFHQLVRSHLPSVLQISLIQFRLLQYQFICNFLIIINGSLIYNSIKDFVLSLKWLKVKNKPECKSLGCLILIIFKYIYLFGLFFFFCIEPVLSVITCGLQPIFLLFTYCLKSAFKTEN